MEKVELFDRKFKANLLLHFTRVIWLFDIQDCDIMLYIIDNN